RGRSPAARRDDAFVAAGPFPGRRARGCRRRYGIGPADLRGRPRAASGARPAGGPDPPGRGAAAQPLTAAGTACPDRSGRPREAVGGWSAGDRGFPGRRLTGRATAPRAVAPASLAAPPPVGRSGPATRGTCSRQSTPVSTERSTHVYPDPRRIRRLRR